MSLTIKTVCGDELEPWADDLARLRIQVFREYPYLYDGSLEYEREYLKTYLTATDAMAVLVLDNGQVVGASTGLPMASGERAFRQPLLQAGFQAGQVFYCGESVLLPEYRGQGVYRRFFAAREAYVHRLNTQGAAFGQLCFCAVIRPDNHPLRPNDYQPLDSVWNHFGYHRLEGLETRFDWQDLDQPSETSHPMSYWLKALSL